MSAKAPTKPFIRGPFKVADLRAEAVAAVRTLKREPPAVLQRALIEHSRGDLFFAYELLRACPGAVRVAKPAQVQKLSVGICDWGTVDCYGSFVSGVAWREGVVDTAFIHRWIKSTDRWYRRAALVSTVPLNQAARGSTAPKGEPAKTLAICERLINDRDDMVVKGLSWALRVLAVKDAASVRSFLKTHDAQLAPRVKREVNNKLKTGLKNPRK